MSRQSHLLFAVAAGALATACATATADSADLSQGAEERREVRVVTSHNTERHVDIDGEDVRVVIRRSSDGAHGDHEMTWRDEDGSHVVIEDGHVVIDGEHIAELGELADGETETVREFTTSDGGDGRIVVRRMAGEHGEIHMPSVEIRDGAIFLDGEQVTSLEGADGDVSVHHRVRVTRTEAEVEDENAHVVIERRDGDEVSVSELHGEEALIWIEDNGEEFIDLREMSGTERRIIIITDEDETHVDDDD